MANDPTPTKLVLDLTPDGGREPTFGVAYDGEHVWVASGESIRAVDPKTGETRARVEVASDAGTAFDGRYLWQLADTEILRVDPATGEVDRRIPAPGKGRDAGLAWAEGKLWVGQHRDRKIFQLDPETGKILRTIESNRFVTGVTWTDGELWHGTWENEESELRRVDPDTGEVLERLAAPAGVTVTGLATDEDGRFYCGSGNDGRLRVLER